MTKGGPMQDSENRPPELLALPGPRIVWWLLGSLAIVLVTGAVIASALGASPALDRQIDVEVRFRSLLWRTTDALGGTRPNKSIRRVSAARRPASKQTAPVALPTAATQAAGDAASLLHQIQETNQQAGKEALRDLFARARQADAAAAQEPDQHHPGRSHTRTAHAAELVVAHAISTHDDGLAAEFARQSGPVSQDLRAALAVLPADPSAAVALDAATVPQARERAHGPGFGRDWSPYTRQRIRARIYAAAGDVRSARDITRTLHDQDGRLTSTILALAQLLLLAGIFGVAIWVAATLRSSAARSRGEPALRWLRARHPGLPEDRPYHTDPLAALLGFAAWLIGYTTAGLLPAVLPGNHVPQGLATLFQGGVGVLLSVAVVQAFARQAPPLTVAARLGTHGIDASFWHASTASLRAYCALIPVMFVATLLGALLFGEGAETHPVAGFLLDDPDALQLISLGLAVVVAAPVGEELLFRGFLYRVLRQRFGIRAALGATALLFAILHMAPQSLLPYTVLGLAFGLVYEWTGSLWASIVLHGLWNFVVFAFVAAMALS